MEHLKKAKYISLSWWCKGCATHEIIVTFKLVFFARLPSRCIFTLDLLNPHEGYPFYSEPVCIDFVPPNSLRRPHICWYILLLHRKHKFSDTIIKASQVRVILCSMQLPFPWTTPWLHTDTHTPNTIHSPKDSLETWRPDERASMCGLSSKLHLDCVYIPSFFYVCT